MNGTVLEGRNGKHVRKNWEEINVVEAGKYDGSTPKKMEWEKKIRTRSYR